MTGVIRQRLDLMRLLLVIGRISHQSGSLGGNDKVSSRCDRDPAFGHPSLAMSTMQAVLCLVWDRVFMMTKRPSGLTVQLFCTYPSVSLEKLQCESPGRDTGLPLNRHPPSCVHTRDVFAQEMSSDS